MAVVTEQAPGGNQPRDGSILRPQGPHISLGPWVKLDEHPSPGGNMGPGGVPGQRKHYESVTSTTLTVTALTKSCPGPTEITHNGKTAAVPEATLLSITDYSCTTITRVCSTSHMWRIDHPNITTGALPNPSARNLASHHLRLHRQNRSIASPEQPTIGPDNKPTASSEEPAEVKPEPNKPTASLERPIKSQNQGAASSTAHPPPPLIVPFTGAATSMIKVGGAIAGVVVRFAIILCKG
ncbi:hypothetical protein BGZ60DRAFT_433857 [Tricladium varicosporioides]|nr:hypothetical protein BGZ60DRAFT_433857 [Hymenoscyphus varicosporioides]